MNALLELQASPPSSPDRVRPAKVATCLISATRWLKAMGVPVEEAMRTVDGLAPLVEDVVTHSIGDLIVLTLTQAGVMAFASDDEAELTEFVAAAERDGLPLLGLNLALIDRMAWEAMNKGGSADAKGRLH